MSGEEHCLFYVVSHSRHCCYYCSIAQPSLFTTPWTAACQDSLSFTISQFPQIHVHWVYNAIQPSPTLCRPLLPLPSASGSFPMSRLFTSGSQSIGVLSSVLPVNIQGWFPLGLIGLISLLSKGLFRVFSSPIQKHQFFGAEPSLWPSTHIGVTPGKTVTCTPSIKSGEMWLRIPLQMLSSGDGQFLRDSEIGLPSWTALFLFIFIFIFGGPGSSLRFHRHVCTGFL